MTVATGAVAIATLTGAVATAADAPEARDEPRRGGGGGRWSNDDRRGGNRGGNDRGDDDRRGGNRGDDDRDPERAGSNGGVGGGMLRRNIRLEKELFPKSFEDGPKTVSTAAIDFDVYESVPVDVTGPNLPKGPRDGITFAEFVLADCIRNSVELSGYKRPTPVQKWSLTMSGCVPYLSEYQAVVASALNSQDTDDALAITVDSWMQVKQDELRDIMACAQTGSGKTAAFLIPILNSLIFNEHRFQPPSRGKGRFKRRAYPRALVLAPVRELASQIHIEARKLTYRSRLRACVVYGGAPIGQQLRELERGADIVIATPGRLIDVVDRGSMSVSSIQFLVMDEADRMLDMGFEPQIRSIIEDFDMPIDNRQTFLFSATFPAEIQQLAQDFLQQDYVFIRVGEVGASAALVEQRVMRVPQREKHEILLDLLGSVPGLTLVFVETKRSADSLEQFLYDQGFRATTIHGDRSQDEREEALRTFREGITPILVATDVVARGLDIPNVTHVVNFDLPSHIDDYVHRIGRTGRAGKKGLSTSFFCDSNYNIVKDLVKKLEEHPDLNDIPRWLVDAAYNVRKSDRSNGRGGRGGDRGGGDIRRRQGGGGGGGGRNGGGGRGGRNGGGRGGGGGGGGLSAAFEARHGGINLLDAANQSLGGGGGGGGGGGSRRKSSNKSSNKGGGGGGNASWW
ncbi:PL10b protein [Thecamonas trahens ATCC 50062]|uniref:RNA helicase n=1 Tax=Thecamonas trahens ATCC 50062 TaxID=461836 RepID=A0A0L0DLQ8_THETB|nr:PL10b protein [Thecamonas trahens ATCC 50062]KNC53242.1 PL10b protein [Thecamonas trahens ATCC 50062]|eukprot:XP_013754508.1 PL10b protein [Thecamonas trahens ATCC 50062]